MLQDTITAQIRAFFGDPSLQVSYNVPPKKEMGDFSTAVCMPFAKTLRKAPVAIAEELAAALAAASLPYIRRIEVSRPGYVNFFVDYGLYAGDLIDKVLTEGDAFGSVAEGGRNILVEHTNVNPNKAMHIGHLRNAIIGDSVVRMLRKRGNRVQACNYIDDTGVQVADVAVAMLYMEPPYYNGENIEEMWQKADPAVPFDYWCWDIYSRISAAYDKDEELKKKRYEVLHLVEAQDNTVAAFAKELASRIVKAHLATAGRLNVFYDLLNWESDIFLRGFWATAFDRLRKSGAVVFETEGPNKGCWVVKYGAGIVETEEGERSEDKILVRSNGIVTYTGKDIAYQLWKFGVLGKDFLYGEWSVQANGKPLATTCPEGAESDRWGRADRVINVIDCRQSYTQQIVYECLDKLGFAREAQNSVHLGYEVVVLSNAAAEALGMETDKDSQVQAMSGRKGLGIKGDDLIDIIRGKIAEKVSDPVTLDKLSCAAVRYFMSKTTNGKILVFDFEEALKTTGDSGIYCEYAHARAASVLNKAGETDFAGLRPGELTATEKALLDKLAEYPAVLEKAAEELSPAPMARYAFELAGAFTGFYENPDPDQEKRVAFINIEDPELRRFRLALAAAFKQVMKNALDSIGIEAVDRI